MVAGITTLTDSVSTANVVYVGRCNSSDADTTKAMWSIERITTDANEDITIENSGGTKDPIYKWSERTTLTYK